MTNIYSKSVLGSPIHVLKQFGTGKTGQLIIGEGGRGLIDDQHGISIGREGSKKGRKLVS